MNRIEVNVQTGESTLVELTPEEEQELVERAATDEGRLAERTRLQAIADDVLRQQLLAQLSTATNLQISAFVDNQVTDLASARTMFKRILLLLAAK